MSRYVLMFCGPGSRPARDLATIKAFPSVRIIDATSSNVVVVEGRASVKSAVNKMANWIASEETVLPDPRPGPHIAAS